MAFNLFDFSNLGGVSSIVPKPQQDTYTEAGVTKQKPKWQIDMEAKQKAPSIPDRSNTILGKVAQSTNTFFKDNPSFMSQGPKEIFGGISQGLQNTATSIKNTGYRDAEGMAEQQKSFISDMLTKGYDKETIFKAMDQLKSQGKFQGSILENPITGTLASVLSAPLQALGTIAKGGESAARAGELAQEGDISGATATFGRGLTEGAFGGLGIATGFTPGGAAVNTAFSSDTVAEPLDKYVSAPIRKGVAKGQEAFGYNPESEGSKALQETAGMVGPLAVLGGAQKYVAPRINSILTKKVSMQKEIKTDSQQPTALQNFGNARAEQILASQWKLDKKTRNTMDNQIGESGAKFALERDLVGKDIEGTANNAGAFKIQKIQEKMNAVKTFGSVKTPEVAQNVASVLKNDIIKNVQKSYGKDADIMTVLERDSPEMARVFALADEVSRANQTDYLKMEQLKELHDYLNPEGIQYDISGKAVSEVGNLLASGKRSKLQNILEEAGSKNGVDIKGINRDIQGSFALQKGLNNAASRIENLNIFGLGDTQTAMISAILGGAPGAIGGLLLKKGLSSEGFRARIAKKIFTKTPKNEINNTTNTSLNGNTSITRMGRIMNNSVDNTSTKVKNKYLINLAEEKAKAGIITKKPDVYKSKILKPNPSTTSDSKIPDGYFKNAFGEIVKNPNSKKAGFISPKAIGESAGLVKKNNYTELFHTTSKENAQKINKEGFIEGKSKGIGDRIIDGTFFVKESTPLSQKAGFKMEGDKEIVKGFVTKDAKIKEFKTADEFEDILLADKRYLDIDDPFEASKMAKKIFMEKGIDVIIKPYGKTKEYIVINPKVLKTESQINK